MDSESSVQKDGTVRLIEEARDGSVNAMGQVFETCRRYLLVIANTGLDSDLRPKTGASDLVQETFLEAQRDFRQFQGDTRGQLLAWLSRILLNNLRNQQRDFRDTQKRQLNRELPLNSDLLGRQASPEETPSRQVIQQEEAEQLGDAIARLPQQYRQVIELRHREQNSFAEIGRALNRSTDAARMLWWRAFERLAEELKEHR